MPIDFSLSPEQHAVRQRARDLAREVLMAAHEATRHLATPEERFVASRPHYRALVQAGLLRRLIPPPHLEGVRLFRPDWRRRYRDRRPHQDLLL